MSIRCHFAGWLFVMMGMTLIFSGCKQESVTVTAPVPTIDEARPLAPEVPITALLRNPYAYENENIRISGSYRPLPLMACKNDPHYSPATWTLSEGGYEVPIAGFDAVLRRLGISNLPMVVEGRWRFWDGPVGCGRRAPEQEVWHLEVSRIISPNPLTQVVAAGPISTPEPTTVTTPGAPASGDEIEITSTSPTGTSLLPTPSLTPSSSPTPSLTETATGTAAATALATSTGEAPPSPTSSVTSTPSPDESEITPTTTTGATVTGTRTPTATVTPTPPATATQVGATGGGTLVFERIARSSLSIEGFHAWRFEALTGDVISISAGPAPNLDIAIELIDPSGLTIAVINNGASGQGESINEMALAAVGDYQVVVRAVGGTSGNYSVVATSQDSEAFLVFVRYLAYGGLGTGSIPADTDHLWNFEASSGDRIMIRVDPANNDDMVLFLIAPDSTEMLFVDDGGIGESEQISEFVISESGTYTIRVGELEFQPAAYTVMLTAS